MTALDNNAAPVVGGGVPANEGDDGTMTPPTPPGEDVDDEQSSSQEASAAATASSGYAIDIRVFLATVTVAMALSFMAGIGFGGPVPILQLLAEHEASAAAAAVIDTHDVERAAADAVRLVPDVRRVDVVPEGPKKAIDLEGRHVEMLRAQDLEKKFVVSNGSDGEEQHLPSGQHLLVDMEGVDASFLNDETRLSQAMVDTVDEAQLTLLSYHCHSLIPSGVSCIGVLLESHISFHTWPEDGVITLDLFTCGTKPLLPVVPTIERLFGIPQQPPSDEGGGSESSPPKPVHTKWSHELRGFRPDDVKRKNYLDGSSDLSLWVLSPLELYSKEQVYSNVTRYQRVDIWDIREVTDTPRYEDVLKHNMTIGDPRLLSPEYATPDRLLFLDGILQSLSSQENIYHEAMVHPAMFAHDNPERVMVIGGGEGATIREVLKHNTVKSALMLDLDPELVQIAKQYLPKMSDCSNLVGRAPYCLDDELVTVQYTDAIDFFKDRYGGSPGVEPLPYALDVILMDLLDPEEETSSNSEQLYADRGFVDALLASMGDDGILAIQIGTAATIDDPREDVGIYKHRDVLFKMLESHPSVEAMLVYEEAHCGFLEPHSFLIVCKSVRCRGNWYARSDLVDYRVYERIVRTRDGDKRALTYYDGTTQHSYQWPKRGWEAVYCRREPAPFECAYRHLDFSAEIHEYDEENEDNGSFRTEIIEEKDAEGKVIKKTTKLYARVDIPEGSYIMPTHLASSLEVTDRNLEGLRKNVEIGGGRVAVIEDLLDFFDDYAHTSNQEGSSVNYIEVGGTCLIRRIPKNGGGEDGDEGGGGGERANVKPWLPPHPSGRRPKYSPVYERHRNSFDVFIVAARDIRAGEEILMEDNMWSEKLE